MLIGLIPMGGQAERWSPLVTPKELLPIGQRSDERPLMLVDYVLEAMLVANVDLVVIPITPVKQYLGHLGRNGVRAHRMNTPNPNNLREDAFQYNWLWRFREQF